MADGGRFTQRGDERGTRDAGSERAGAFRGQDGPRGGAGGERGESAGRGGAGARTWSRDERYEAGGGIGWTGPSGLGSRTDAGYGAGAAGYGAPDPGAPAEWRARQGSGAAPIRNRGPKGWQRSDERIYDDVCARLADEAGIDPSGVSVEVRSGTVTLTGTVPDRSMKYRIEDIVDGCSGVGDVDNRLRVARGGMGGLLGTGTMGTTTDARSGSVSRGSLLGRLFGFASGTRLADVMTRDPRTIGPDETLEAVARAMKEQDVGAIPVCRGRTLAGMVTDRDLVVRAVAEGKPLAQTKVSEVMTAQVHTCDEDEDVESALDKMGDLQVRRIPVVDRGNRLVGIVSLGDFAQRDAGDVEDALQDISQRS